MNLESLLDLVPDKSVDKTTTSKKFKRDVFEFFNKDEFKSLECLEVGCKNGYSTLILTHLFKHVHGVNYDRTKEADDFLRSNGRENYTLYAQDVYKYGFPITKSDVIFIDAIHTYKAVIKDIENSLNLKSEGKKYLIFDDIGLYGEVSAAVKECINHGLISVEKRIGYDPLEPNGKHFLMDDFEGLICREV